MRGLLAVVILLTPAVAGAQRTDVELEGWSFELAQELLDVPEPPAHTRLRPHLGPEFDQSHGHAWMGFAMGAALGYAGGALAGYAAACEAGPAGGCLTEAMISGAIGSAILAPLLSGIVTYGIGASRGGSGNLFATLAGSILGAGAPAGIGALIGWAADDLAWGLLVGGAVGVVLSNLGAAVGYQESSSYPPPAVSLSPYLAPTAQGAVAGAGGSF